MRSPLGDLLHDLLSSDAESEAKQDAWRDVDRKLVELTADYVVELEFRGLACLAARIEGRIAQARKAIKSELYRFRSDVDADTVTIETIRDACFLVDATDRRIDSSDGPQHPPNSIRGSVPNYLSAADPIDEIGDADPEAPPLTENEIAVIITLAKFDPSRLAPGAAIEEEMSGSIRLSRRTIQPIVTRLIDLGLVERPLGKRSGVRLTMAGRRLAPKIAD